MAKKENKTKSDNKYERFAKPKREDKNVEKVKVEENILKGKCLKCKKPMFKNHKRCKTCLRKWRISRGKKK